jgi:hypothetical protein
MKLKPVIASYSGESYTRIKQYLDDPVLQVIASVAQGPQPEAQLSPQVLAELVEMHVLRQQDGQACLGTAVFLEDDIQRVVSAVTPLAQELARRIQAAGAAFQPAPAEVTCFLGGIIGYVQGLGRFTRQKEGGAAEWKTYPGKYERSKVDFDQICPAYETLGPDYLNKSVLPGESYTAVFIGPGGVNFESLNFPEGVPELKRGYASQVNRYLVDAYARLVAGEAHSQALQAAAEAAHLYRHGALHSAVITNATLQAYGEAVQAVMETTAAYMDSQLDVLDELLRSTTSGRQGVPPANMLMHLFRYIRKLAAQSLYAQGFLTDTIPQDGCLTVFYKNDVELIRQLLF